MPAADPALVDLEQPGAIVHWDATRFDPPRSTWLPGNTTPDLVVVAIDGEGPVDLVSLAGDVVADDAAEAVRTFVQGIDWAV